MNPLDVLVCRRTFVPWGTKSQASRDGDRFHYYWAAMRALLLLDPLGDVKKPTIMGNAATRRFTFFILT